MLEGLLGNKNVGKVLLFLFVNGKGYGAELQRSLHVPLTSLPHACTRLEEGRVVVSYLEGKTKIYRLNPSYPLLAELEQLLQKAYTLLSPEEKKKFSLVQKGALEIRAEGALLVGFWERLKTVKQMRLHAKSHAKNETGWNGIGKGEVVVLKESDTTTLFQERGVWQMQRPQEVTFTNTFRWILDRKAGLISLEHLRLGPHAPVFLFHLAPVGEHFFASVDAHLCEEDAYLAQVVWDRYEIRLSWRVIGPRKNEEMEYHYF